MARKRQKEQLDPKDIAIKLEEVPLFSALTSEMREELAKLLHPRRFSSGQPVFLQGDPGDEMFLVLEGRVRVSCESMSGREVTLAMMKDGGFFGDMAMLDGEPRSASVYAETGCKALVLRRTEFYDFLDRSPESARNLLAFLSKRLREANDKIQDLALLTVRQRLAAVLVDLALKDGEEHENGIMLAKSVNHRVLAGLLGASRETVSRMAAEFREGDLIEQHGRRVLVKDLDGLRAMLEE